MTSGDSLKRPGEFPSVQARKRFAAGTTTPVATSTYTEESDSAKPIDRLHADAIMNYLTRIACQVFVVFEGIFFGFKTSLQFFELRDIFWTF